MSGAKPKIAFVSGNFYYLHPGHIRFLRFAAHQAEKLVIGVNPETPSEDYPTVEDRVEVLESLDLNKEVVVLTEGLDAALKIYKPEILVMGKEHESSSLRESELIGSWGGRIIFSSGNSNQYTGGGSAFASEINKLDGLGVSAQQYRMRRHIDKAKLRAIFDKIENLCVLVVGDLIIDQYISCDILGLSREDPAMVVCPSASEKFVGGAGIVSAHAASLGAKVYYVCAAGDDDNCDFADLRLGEFGVRATLLRDSSRPTTLKARYKSNNKTLFRVSYLEQHSIGKDIRKKVLAEIEGIKEKVDLVIFSDFSYGCLPQDLVNEITELPKLKSAKFAADSQSSSQIGDISRFKAMDLITPTEYEARVTLQDEVSGLALIANNLLDISDSKAALITLGQDGVFILEKKCEMGAANYQFDTLPAFSKSAVDVAGAGDSMLAAAALCLAAGGSIFESAYIGSCAAALQVEQEGNMPISKAKLVSKIISNID